MMKWSFLLVLLFTPLIADATDFQSTWPDDADRVWPGPQYWPNPLQDWHVAGGRLECRRSGGDRNVHLLTRDLGPGSGTLYMSVNLGRLDGAGEGWAGFMIGMRGQFDDYRDTAVRGRGLHCGISHEGKLFIGRLEESKAVASLDHIDLRLEAYPSDNDYRITLSALDARGQLLAQVARSEVKPDWLEGGLALACCSGKIYETPVYDKEIKARGWGMRKTQKRGGDFRCWFRDWKVGGTKVMQHDGRTFGPILFALHTVESGVMKMTAQMAPAGGGAVKLTANGNEWQAAIDPLARTATFRIPEWNQKIDTAYRLVYDLDGRDWAYEGTIRKDPADKKKIVVAAFTGNNDFGFPHQGVYRGVSHFNPDFLVFTGDQIYEGVAGFSLEREPVEIATLDYLRKWYILGWAFGDLIKDRPTVCLPDDHDVYHGNIWGAGGRKAPGRGAKGQDQGGYTMDAEWVKMVHRTQTSHMPDPFDPTPVEQGIPVYYTALSVGGVSFAVIEDRKWKSPPKLMLPDAQIHNGWAQNPEYDAATQGDAPQAKLLDERQLQFLEQWAVDWSRGTWMKAVLSQTIFANVATLPDASKSDGVTTGLKIMPPGGYAEGDKIVMDHDSNGWPQTGRNKALRAMRRGFAVHIAGDQHLGSTVQYGVDDWNDAAYAICVPSISNIFPRRWFPPEPGNHHEEDAPKYTGEFHDGFGNKITVHAVSNPHTHGVEPAAVNNRSPGYGIIAFDRETRKITFANWPKWVDPRPRSAKPYPGWPITVDQLENYNGKVKAYLPTLKVSGMAHPVVQVIREKDNEIVYTLRIRGSEFTPMVFEEGQYTLKIGEPGGAKFRTLEHVASNPTEGVKIIELDLLR